VQNAQIVIVGGGPAGLSTAGALKRVGLTAVVLDKDSAVGSSWLRRYDRLHLHTIRRFSALAYSSIPRTYPKYMSRNMYAEYLRSYAQRFAIDVMHNCNVEAIRVDTMHQNNKSVFSLETSQGSWAARAVVIATGEYGDPPLPELAGFDKYQGHTIHSSIYTTGRMYAGKRVLVVGLGNTGAEIATDLVEQGATFVAVSIRTTPPIVPRDFIGTPVQLFGIALSRVPAPFADWIGSKLARIALGDLTRYGLRKAQWSPFSAKRIPVIDVGFVDSVKRRRISIRPTITCFSTDGVVYSDGREENFDVVILATGYETGLDRLLKVPGMLDEAGFPRFASGERTAQPGLYFMGFFESHRGHLYEIAIASRRLARTIGSDLALDRTSASST
jgi:cation diffusion facilitator CzcD-associated flavoprotein CzcO